MNCNDLLVKTDQILLTGIFHLMIWPIPSQLSIINLLKQANKESLIKLLVLEHSDLGQFCPGTILFAHTFPA